MIVACLLDENRSIEDFPTIVGTKEKWLVRVQFVNCAPPYFFKLSVEEPSGSEEVSPPFTILRISQTL